MATVTSDVLVNGRGRITVDEALIFIAECDDSFSARECQRKLSLVMTNAPGGQLRLKTDTRTYELSYDPGTHFFWVRPKF